MQQYYDLEINVLSCLLHRPELMKKLKLEDKYFIKQKKVWQFMKSFYEKYQTFDFALMFNVCADKFRFMEYMEYILDAVPTPSRFELYQDQLIELYNEKQKEKIIIEHIYKLSNDLLVRNISLEEFYKKIEEVKHMDDGKEKFVCSNCGEEYTEDEKGTSELALQDNICIYCMENGYGQ